MRQFLLFIVAVIISTNSLGQTILSSGDIAIIGFNFDNPDEIAFVALVDMEDGTEIKFTDNGWKADNTFRANEGIHTWTANGAITKGQVFTLLTSGPAFASSGDQIIAYQGENDTPTFIFALNAQDTGWQTDTDNASDSALPTDLIEGTSAIALPEVDNGYYNGSTSGTTESLLAQISTSANWTTNDNRMESTNWLSSFTITSGEPNTIEKTPSNLNCYPNPFNTQLTVRGSHITVVEIINTIGQVTKRIEGNKMNKMVISTTDLKNGIYIVKITDNKANVISIKLMKK